MLSKSSFMQFLRCSCELWLYKQRPDLAPAYDAATLRVFATGNEVDGWAMKLYPTAVNVMGKGAGAVEKTKKAIAKGARVLLQPTFIVEAFGAEITCRADIMKKNSDDSWDLLEVKSTTQVKPEHLMDMAFQRIVLEEAGLKIRKTVHVHIDNQYVRQGEIEPEKLFARTDVTHEVEELLPLCGKEIPRALAVLEWGTEPNLDIIKNCTDPEKCEFRACILKAMGEEDGTYKITPVNPDLKIDKTAIKEELGNLTYPLYFLDYETYNPAIPLFDGYKPYQQCVFQYSIHILKTPKSKLEHVEVLVDELTDPAPIIARALAEHIGPTGSVISWNMIFEASRNEELGDLVPQYADHLRSINERMFDLMMIVKKGYYKDARFEGSASLKKVLPVMCPELSYDALAIHEGGTASASWPILTDPSTKPADKAQLRKDMLAYCELDTLAMVEIYKKFLTACG